MNRNCPKISVITVVRNGEKYIEETIQSIINQTYGNFEYIIIDGKSTDNTLNIIKQYESQITYWISESDKGIYDAMNKGIRAATGDWLLFINSDDFLFEKDVLEKVAPILSNCASLVAYGDVILIYPGGSENIRGCEWSQLKHHFRNIRMNISHQGVFHSKALFKDRLYDASFKIAADYDLLLSYLKDHDPQYIPHTIAKMRILGISANAGDIQFFKEIRRAQQNNGIYKTIPSFGWFKSAIQLTLNAKIIKVIGIERKDKIKQLIRRMKS